MSLCARIPEAIWHIVKAFIHFGTSGRNRLDEVPSAEPSSLELCRGTRRWAKPTCDRLIRSGMLYSTELRKHIFVGVVELEPKMSEDWRFFRHAAQGAPVSCNSHYATPQYLRKQKDWLRLSLFQRSSPICNSNFRSLLGGSAP